MRRVVAFPVLMLALMLGLLPGGQCASRLLLSYCCCEVQATQDAKPSCCAKHATAPNGATHIAAVPATAKFCTHTVADALQAGIETIGSDVIAVSAPAPLPLTLHLASPQPIISAQARPPDTPIFITIQTFLI